MNLNRLIDTQGLSLSKGAHLSRDQGTCVMEAVAWLAGEDHSDQPYCTAPMIAKILIRWNDRLKTDAERAKWLGPLIVHVVGTNHPELNVKRGYICADYAIRKIAPLTLRLRGMNNDAEKLENLSAIINKETAMAGNKAAADAEPAYAYAYANVGDADAYAYAAYADAAYAAFSDGAYAADALNQIMTDMVMDLCLISDGKNPERDMLIKTSKSLELA